MTKSDSPLESDSGGLSIRWKVLISCAVMFHLLAVVSPPLAFQAQGPLGRSPAVQTALTPVQAYCQFTYIDRGYAFFAPNPGPSHLFDVATQEPDAQLTEITYPNINQQWPRLNYHRHFMLAEYLNTNYREKIAPLSEADLSEEDKLFLGQARTERARYEHLRRSFADHVSHLEGGKDTFIRRVEHRIPSHIEFNSRSLDLSDRSLYIRMPDQMIDLGSGELVGPPESIPAPGEDNTGSSRLFAPNEKQPTDETPDQVEKPIENSPQAKPSQEDGSPSAENDPE